MDMILGVVTLLLVLFLVGRGTPLRRWLPIVAATLAVILAVVLIERTALWPRGWTTR